jgi:hypothetical protein
LIGIGSAIGPRTNKDVKRDFGKDQHEDTDEKGLDYAAFKTGGDEKGIGRNGSFGEEGPGRKETVRSDVVDWREKSGVPGFGKTVRFKVNQGGIATIHENERKKG